MKWLILALVVALSGCADSVEYRLGGQFTTERTSADLASFDAKVMELGGDSVLMESWPEQFRVTFTSSAACDAMHNWLHVQNFVDQTHDNHCEIV